MNSRPLILGSAWALSLAVAFLIGSGRDTPAAGTTEGTRGPAAPSKALRPAADQSESARDRRSASADPGVRLVAQLSPREAVAALALLDDPISRVQGFLALVDSLSPEEFEGVVADFRALGMTEQRFTEYGILLHAWRQNDPQGALAYAMENTGTPFARQTILASWAAYDPDAAIAFAESNYQGDGANPLLVGVIRGLARDDMNRATGLMLSLPRSRERGDALNAVLPMLLAEGVDSALTWSDGLTDDSLRSGALASIARHVAEDDPARAAELLLTAPDEDTKLRALDDIASSWAAQDLDAAIAFTDTLLPGLKGEGVEGVISQFASTDPVRASAWLESVAAEGVNIDPAIGRFIWAANSEQPELSANWIGQMTDQRQAERNYHRFLGRWIGTDEAAARAWIATSELPESVQRRFSQQNEQRQ